MQSLAKEDRSVWVVEFIGEAALTAYVEQTASIDVDGTSTPSRSKNGRNRKANATYSVVVTRITSRSKASKNGRKLSSTK
jgi:hypothetical protein